MRIRFEFSTFGHMRIVACACARDCVIVCPCVFMHGRVCFRSGAIFFYFVLVFVSNTKRFCSVCFCFLLVYFPQNPIESFQFFTNLLHNFHVFLCCQSLIISPIRFAKHRHFIAWWSLTLSVCVVRSGYMNNNRREWRHTKKTTKSYKPDTILLDIVDGYCYWMHKECG